MQRLVSTSQHQRKPEEARGNVGPGTSQTTAIKLPIWCPMVPTMPLWLLAAKRAPPFPSALTQEITPVNPWRLQHLLPSPASGNQTHQLDLNQRSHKLPIWFRRWINGRASISNLVLGPEKWESEYLDFSMSVVEDMFPLSRFVNWKTLPQLQGFRYVAVTHKNK